MPAFSLQQTNKSILLINASKRGDIDEVKRLIPISNPKFENSQALIVAAEHGHLDVVKILIPVSDPKAASSWPLRMAARNGHVDIAQLLIPVSNQSDHFSACREAIFENQIETTQMFFPYFEKQADYNNVLLFAAQYQKSDIIDLLLPFCDYNCICNYDHLKEDSLNLLKHRIEYYEVKKQQKTLLEHIETEHSAAPSLKRKI